MLNPDADLAASTSSSVIEFTRDELDLDPTNAIPGLVVAIGRLALETTDPEQAFIEACDMLSRGDVE